MIQPEIIHHFLCPSHFFIPLPPKHQEQYKNLHQPSMTATVVKIRCGNKFNFKNKSLWTITCSNIQNSALLYFQTIVASNILWISPEVKAFSFPVSHDLLTSAIYRFMIEELRFHKPLWFILWRGCICVLVFRKRDRNWCCLLNHQTLSCSGLFSCGKTHEWEDRPVVPPVVVCRERRGQA